MRFHFIRHAYDSMAMRKLDAPFVVQSLGHPDSIARSEKVPGRLIAKRKYLSSHGKPHLLIVIYEPLSAEDALVISVFDTSKVSKYS
jgi:hypothetical protein